MSKIKITFVGDIMCEPLLLRAARRSGDSFDFSSVFNYVAPMFADSDYVIGNLETPVAGAAAGYTKGLFSFNTPVQFAQAAKDSGIDLVSTANNHCLDRGFDGLLATQRMLRSIDLPYVGTSMPDEERPSAYIADIGGTKVAVIAYTYGTNYRDNKCLLDDEKQKCVNLLRPQTESYFKPSDQKATLKKRAINKFLCYFSEERRFHIKKALGMVYNTPHTDDNLMPHTAAPYIANLQENIRKAKEQADYVVFYPHVGGQFNAVPGEFSEYVFEKAMDAGCDAIVASHAHVVHKADIKNNVPCFFSLGNFSMSPNSVYLLHENLPDYGLAAHLYMENGEKVKASFSVLKIVESKKEMLTVYPVKELYELLNTEKEKAELKQAVGQIYSQVTGKAIDDNFVIESEYCLTSQ